MDLTMPPYAPVAFNALVTFGWIGLFLIVGMVLRSTFPVFRQFLIPACIIGGVVGFLFQSFGVLNMTGFGMDNGVSQLIVFHLFNLTWVYLGLKAPAPKSSQSASTSKFLLWFVPFMMMGTYLSLGFGMLSTAVLSDVGLNSGPATIGSLTAYGFIAGPGQTFTIANVWAASTSFTALPDFALAGGAMGFALAITVGVFLLNIIARKKKLNLLTCPSEEEQCGFYGDCTPTEDAGQQTTSSTSIDVFAWHLALGLAIYLISYIIAVLLFIILPPSLKILVWSVFFLFASMMAMGARWVITKMGKGHLLCAGINNRISNSLVDFMVCATFMTIQVGNIIQYLSPYFLSVAACIFTISIYLWFYCSKLEGNRGVETFAYMFGTMTGTVSTGFILLRLVDPNNNSEVPVVMALASAITFPMTAFVTPVLMHMEPLYGSSAYMPIAISFGIAIVCIILARIFRQPLTKTAWEPSE